MFWRLTPRETFAAMEAINRRQELLEDAANTRAGLVAATVINTSPNRRPGSRAARPQDFFRKAKAAQTLDEMARVLDALAARQNRTADN